MKTLMSMLLVLLAAGSVLPQEDGGADSSGKTNEKFFFTTRKFAMRHHWYWGVGAVVSDVPVLESRFKVPFSQILYEYNLGDLNSNFRFALGGGFYGLNAILPVPAFQPSFYIGNENSDVMGRISVGVFSDIVVGGHSGVLLSAGAVIKNRIDVSFVVVPAGTQPVRPYPEILGSQEEEFLPLNEVAYTKDPEGKTLIKYDSKHHHPDDPKFDAADTVLYYSSYDVDYGNGELSSNHKANPGDFDYITGREYIKFPYFGIMVTFRH